MSESVGGQALIEGVMMKKGDDLAKAVRKDGRIIVEKSKWKSSKETFRNTPFVRGAFLLWDSMRNGLEALRWSSEIVNDTQQKKDSIFSDGEVIFAIMLTFALFFALPHLVTTFLFSSLSGFAFHGVVGVFKLSIFLLYISLISRTSEVKRVFSYHGAEHKVVNAYEDGNLHQNPSSISRYSRFHTRCGTSFMFIVLMVSIVLFSLLFGPLPATFVGGSAILTTLFLILLKIPLLIPIAGISYEIFTVAAANSTKWWAKPLLVPGMVIQRLTTREPTWIQIEVAKAALVAVLEEGREIDS